MLLTTNKKLNHLQLQRLLGKDDNYPPLENNQLVLTKSQATPDNPLAYSTLTIRAGENNDTQSIREDLYQLAKQFETNDIHLVNSQLEIGVFDNIKNVSLVNCHITIGQDTIPSTFKKAQLRNVKTAEFNQAPIVNMQNVLIENATITNSPDISNTSLRGIDTITISSAMVKDVHIHTTQKEEPTELVIQKGIFKKPITHNLTFDAQHPFIGKQTISGNMLERLPESPQIPQKDDARLPKGITLTASENGYRDLKINVCEADAKSFINNGEHALLVSQNTVTPYPITPDTTITFYNPNLKNSITLRPSIGLKETQLEQLYEASKGTGTTLMHNSHITAYESLTLENTTLNNSDITLYRKQPTDAYPHIKNSYLSDIQQQGTTIDNETSQIDPNQFNTTPTQNLQH